MDINILIGIIIVATSLTVITALTVWARATINRIADKGYTTARQTLRHLNSEK